MREFVVVLAVAACSWMPVAFASETKPADGSVQPAVETAEPKAMAAPGSFEAGLEIYDAANASGDPFSPKYKEALAVWMPLADEGHPGALYHVGLLYYLGPGGITVDQVKGHHLIRQAASNGYGTAQGLLGLMSEKGDGLIQNRGPDIALKWYMLGAFNRHCASLKRVVKAYETGDLGLRKDEAAAERWSQFLEGCTKR